MLRGTDLVDGILLELPMGAERVQFLAEVGQLLLDGGEAGPQTRHRSPSSSACRSISS